LLLCIFTSENLLSLCHFAVSPGQPSLISDDADVVALIGTSKDLAKQINQKEVHWGVCFPSIWLFPTLIFMKLLALQNKWFVFDAIYMFCSV
jgi:hypothetical protein